MVYLKTKEVADTLGITKRTLQNWISHKKIPIPQKATNGYYLWSHEELKAAIDYKARLLSETHYRFSAQS